MIRNTAFILLLFFSILSGYGQGKSSYADDMTEVDENIQSNDFNEALSILVHMNKNDNISYNVSYKMGLCYMHIPMDYEKAIQSFLKACNGISEVYNQNDPTERSAPKRVLFDLGDAYRLADHWNEAIESYRKFEKSLSPSDFGGKQSVKNRIRECEFAKAMIKNPIKVEFSEADDKINNGFSNYAACLSGDGSTMVFLRALKFYNAIFISHRTLEGWAIPEEITSRLGIDGDFIPTGLNNDGTQLLLTGFSILSGNDIYESKFEKGKWTKVHKLIKISSSFNDEDAVYAPDGKSIYFSSNRDHGKGGYDIYCSTKDSLGNWSNVKNAGAPVNTAFDERSPGLSDGGNTLIFSSNMGSGMGGFDFYYCHRNASGKFGTVYNLGYPINTAADDLGYKPVNKSGDAIISRFSNQGNGNNEIVFVHCDSFSLFRSVPVIGKVSLGGSRVWSEPVQVEFIDNNSGDTVERTSLISDNYQVQLYPGKFKLHIANQGEQSFQIPFDTLEPDFFLETAFEQPKESLPPQTLPEIATTLSVEKPVLNHDTIFVSDVLFEFNRYKIIPLENDRLNVLIQKLLKYKDMHILLAGYSDVFGDITYNKQLSLLRAIQVKKRLIEKGLNSENIAVEGHGSTNFIANNQLPNGKDNPKGRALNRRVEIKISGQSSSVIIILKSRAEAR